MGVPGRIQEEAPKPKGPGTDLPNRVHAGERGGFLTPLPTGQ